MADNKKDTVIPIDDEIESASKFCGLMFTSLRGFFILVWLSLFVAACSAVFFGMQAHTSALEKAAVTPVIRMSVSPNVHFEDPKWKFYSDLVVFDGKWTFLMAYKTCTMMGYELLNFRSLSQAQEFDKWITETMLWNEPEKDLQLWTDGQLQSRSNPNGKYYTAPFDYFSRATLKSDGYPECYSIKGGSVHDGKLDRGTFFTRYNIALDYDKKNFADVELEYNKTKACWMETRSNNINPTLKYSFACQKYSLIEPTTTIAAPSSSKPTSPPDSLTTTTTEKPTTTAAPNIEDTPSPYTSAMTMEYPKTKCTPETVKTYNEINYANIGNRLLNGSISCQGGRNIKISFAKYYRLEPLKRQYSWFKNRSYYKESKKCNGEVTKAVQLKCENQTKCALCPNHEEFGHNNWRGNSNAADFSWHCASYLFGSKEYLMKWELKVIFQCMTP